jgi:hypothetical protein
LLILAFGSYSLTGFTVSLGVTIVEEPLTTQQTGNLTRLSVRVLGTDVRLDGSNQTLPRSNVRVSVDGFRQLTRQDGFAHFVVATGLHEVNVLFAAPTFPTWATWRNVVLINTTTLLLLEFVDQVITPQRAELLLDAGRPQTVIRLDVNASTPTPTYATDLEVLALERDAFAPESLTASREGPPIILGLSTIEFEVPAAIIWADGMQVHLRYSRALIVETAEE